MLTQRFAKFELLPEDECETFVLKVLLLKKHWLRRHAQVPFYTLGLAAYLDDCNIADKRYLEYHLSQSNELLAQHFLALYQQLGDFFEQQWGLKTRYNLSHLALPGFHIYQPHPAFAQPLASIHRDLQYQKLFGIEAGQQTDNVITFTLPLSTPTDTGLNLWSSPDEAEADLFVPYTTGELVVHSGLEQHQAVINCTGLDERITLQGHGIRKDQQLILYW
jgi:hypothetical protein